MKLDEERHALNQLQRSEAGQVVDLVYPAPVILGLVILSLLIGGAFNLIVLS